MPPRAAHRVAVILFLLAAGTVGPSAMVGEPALLPSSAPTPHAPGPTTSAGSASAPVPSPPSDPIRAYLRHETESPQTRLLTDGPDGYIEGSQVGWLAFGAWDDSFYVSAPPSSVDVVAPGNGTIESVVSVGSDPFGIATDPSADLVFAADSGSDNVTVINGSSERTLGSFSVQTGPDGLAYDAKDEKLFVANNGSDTVSEISLTSWKVLANVSVGSHPLGVAWDGSSDRVFVTDYGSAEVSVLSGSSGALLSNVSVGSDPYGIADDNATGDLYVANQGTDNVSVVSAQDASVVATIPIAGSSYSPDLEGVAYDSVHRMIWVTAGATVAVIDPAVEGAIEEVPYDPAGAAFDPSDGSICVTNSANATFRCFVYGPSLLWDANLTFEASGLPAGTRWNVTLEGSLSEVTQVGDTDSIRFGADCHWEDGGFIYEFIVGAPAGYTATPTFGSIQADCVDTNISISFAAPGSFFVTFEESGLPKYSAWGVTLDGDTDTADAGAGPPVEFAVPNGTYGFDVESFPGYFATPAFGNVTVYGADVRVTILWEGSETYRVNFLEHGLPNGTPWNVTLGHTLNGTRGNSVGFAEPNGSYAYNVADDSNYTSVPSSGWANVSGSWVNVSLAFSPGPAVYDLRFEETGLPGGTTWSIRLSGTNRSSSSTNISYGEPNGTYPYTIASVGSYSPSPAAGNVTVLGAGANISVTFSNGSSPIGGNRPLRILAFTVLPSSIALGSTISVSVATSGGQGELSFAYFGFPTGCAPANESNWTCRPTAAGTSAVSVKVSDGSGAAESANATLTVRAGAGPAGRPAPTELGVGVGLLVIVAVVALAAWRARRGRRVGPEGSADASDPYYSAAPEFRLRPNAGPPVGRPGVSSRASPPDSDPPAAGSDDPLSGFL